MFGDTGGGIGAGCWGGGGECVGGAEIGSARLVRASFGEREGVGADSESQTELVELRFSRC